MIGEFNNVKIQGMASAVPEYIENNENYESLLGKRRVKKQIQLTGVLQRHVSDGKQRTSDLCYAAATRLMDWLKWDKNDIKVLILLTQSPNYHLPSTAFFLQQRLGIGKDCVAFDINLGCSAFNVGVQVVSSLLQSCSEHDKALLLIGDMSGIILKPDWAMDEKQIANKMLFGSAGAAVALEKVENQSLKFMNKSDGTGFEAIMDQGGTGSVMDGMKVFEFAINDVAEDVKRFRNHFGLGEQDIDYYIFHQAQKLILDDVADVCNIPEGKELRSLDKYGNTSGTSVPVTVCANEERFKNQESVRLLLCGFGVGLSWGIIYSEIPSENILPVFATNERFDEDKKMVGPLKGNPILVTEADTEVGECISRYLNDKSARVILTGTLDEKLRFIKKDLYLESYIVSSVDDPTKNIVNLCQEEELKLSGIVVPDSKKLDVSFILALKDADILDRQASVVILSDIEGLKDQADNQYAEAKHILQMRMEDLQNKLQESEIRVNAILYDKSKWELMQVTGNGQAWIEHYLQKGCPQSMKRPLYVNHAIKYLLSKESLHTNGTIMIVGG